MYHKFYSFEGRFYNSFLNFILFQVVISDGIRINAKNSKLLNTEDVRYYHIR
jgi:hypothetical protein